jgi:hypothetical protein
MTKSRWVIVALIVAVLAATLTFAQRYYDRRPVPHWAPDKQFSEDVFTFVRIRYSSGYGGGYGRGGRGRYRRGSWATDYPDSDLNFSYRLQQLTSMEVNPDGLVLELTDPRLFDYPFIYIVEPGRLVFTSEEVTALRCYLLNGGFLMVDDFWGEAEWYNFYREIKRVFPDRDLDGRYYGITWEREDAREVHFKAIRDDHDQIMVIICHNTDLGDGWEREGENEWYFHEFSEKKAYPLGINIVFYAMTH